MDRHETLRELPGGLTLAQEWDHLGRLSGAVLAEQATTAGGTGTGSSADDREQITTWDYQPGTFTPLAQATRTSLRDAPQQTIDEQFYAITTDLTGTPAELIAPDGTRAGTSRLQPT